MTERRFISKAESSHPRPSSTATKSSTTTDQTGHGTGDERPTSALHRQHGGQHDSLHRQDRPSAKDFIEALQRVGPPMGFNVGRPNTVQLENDRTDNFLKNIRNNLSQTTQMVIVVLPSNRKDRYDSIKKLCCVELPVPSQCILQITLSKKQNLMSVATKVAMQLNCKLGGELWAVEIPVKNLMVVGIGVLASTENPNYTEPRALLAARNEAISR